MATMIPDLDPRMIENDGERMAYAALKKLPADYTVLYSFTFRTMPPGAADPDFGEADFVVVHPRFGYLVLEVKQGKIGFTSGQWYEEKQHGPQLLAKNPVVQAQKAMYAILQRYKEKAGSDFFPLSIRYGLWFPECRHVWGQLPASLERDCILLEDALDAPEEAVRRAFAAPERPPQRGAIDCLINKVLAPAFKTFARLDEEIDRYDRAAQRVLTEEQERILEETELDRRKVFLGAAGTGKTFVAMEKARRLAAAGKRVFLTCYNKNLAAFMRKQVPAEVVCQNFHDFLLETLQREGKALEVPSEGEDQSRFFDETLPTRGFDHYSCAPLEDKFDAVIVDEGQDFSGNWYTCLQAMLRDEADGEFYVFADPNQDLFRHNMDWLLRLPVSKQRLTRNLRNTEPISKWIGPFVKDGRLYPGLQGGIPVVQKAWESYAEEKQMIESEVGRLVSQGVKPSRIVILSANRLEKSSLAGCDRIKDWRLEDFRSATGNSIRFSTIRAFKGLEADVVFLIGLKAGKQTCTDADVYVGASRARFLLYVFYNRSEPPSGVGG